MSHLHCESVCVCARVCVREVFLSFGSGAFGSLVRAHAHLCPCACACAPSFSAQQVAPALLLVRDVQGVAHCASFDAVLTFNDVPLGLQSNHWLNFQVLTNYNKVKDIKIQRENLPSTFILYICTHSTFAL